MSGYVTPEQLANLKTLLAQLEGIGKAIGSYTTKADARETGCSIHFKFENKVDVMSTTMDFVSQVERAPALLANACRRLITAYEQEPAA